MFTGVVQGGPLQQSHIIPGMIVSSLGGEAVTNGKEMIDLLNRYEPGDLLTITIVEYDRFNRHQFKNIDVRLRAGMPKK